MEDLKAKWQAVCELVQNQMKRLGVPGVAVGLWYGGETFAAGFGVTNADNPLPVTDTTLFQIGSITKTFMGTAAMCFVDQGKIALSDPVRKYLPKFETPEPDVAPKVTIRHLLNHMGGWDGDIFIDSGEGPEAMDYYIGHIKDQMQLVPFDTAWSYNNSGFAVLARILEVVGGKRYEDLLTDLVLTPLGLTNTYLDSWDVMTLRYASGHAATPNGCKVLRPWHLSRGFGAAAKITSTVRDLMAYARFHMGEGSAPNGERLMSTENLRKMRTPDTVLYGALKWGLSFCVDDSLGPRQACHGGGTVAQVSDFRFISELGFAMAILTNADTGGQLIHETRVHILKQWLDLDEKELKPIQATPDQLAEFVGKYSRSAGDTEVGIVAGQLVAIMTPKISFPDKTVPVGPPSPPVPMVFAGKDLLTYPSGPMVGSPVHVIRKPDGTIGGFRGGNRIWKKVK